VVNRRKNDKTFVLGLGRIIVAIIVLLFLMRTFVADLAIVRGRSMLPGLKASDIVFVFKAAYGLRNPRGGYLLLWSEPEERQLVAAVRPESTAVFIKRVASVLIMDNPEAPLEIGKGYYLLGDNKYESIDSRDFGPVPMNNILGRVFPIPGF